MVENKLKDVHSKIESVCKRAGRKPEEIRLVLVSKQVSIDSDDTKVSFQIELPIPTKSPKKPNAKLTFEGDRQFSRFYCNKK